MGIDGEGQNDSGGRHRYMTMACVDADGKTVGEVAATMARGLGTEECFEFLLTLPTSRTQCFAYSFGYDLAKILEDLDDCSLYRLFRPDTRRKIVRNKNGSPSVGFVPVFWKDYKLTYLNGQFSVARMELTKRGERILDPEGRPMTTPSFVIHDIWRFFGSKFTSALEDWKVGTPEELKRMREMKDLRSEFDKLDPKEIRAYCLKECQFMAVLAVKLKAAHKAAGIPLRNWYGAGSTASGLLDTMGIKDHLKAWKGEGLPMPQGPSAAEWPEEHSTVRKSRRWTQPAKKKEPFPEAMRDPVAKAFFGGRFENSVIGAVPGVVDSWDISSAYPYQCCFLPCLVHSSWERVTGSGAEEAAWRAPHALVRYVLRKPEKERAWGPLPFRLKDGSICYPSESAGGWIWREEFFTAKKFFPEVEGVEAWVYRADCSCRPFEKMPEYYKERVRIGKEGAGIVIKLGCNSVYGKCAQSAGGGGTFTCWIWAGMITSGCRAQGLEVLGMHADMGNMLMIATDGIATREKLKMPEPRDTGTSGDLPCPVGSDAPDGVCRKPLGGWEYKALKKGLFLARPGIYFPLEPTEKEIKLVRARGVGRGVIYDQWKTLVGEYEAARRGEGTWGDKERGRGAGIEDAVVHVKDLSRFIGAKTGITRAGERGAWRYRRSSKLGQWISRPVEMTFNPLPKREGVRDVVGGRGTGGESRTDGKASWQTMGVRNLAGVESVAYDPATVSPEAQMLKDLLEEMVEQPDGGDYAYGMGQKMMGGI